MRLFRELANAGRRLRHFFRRDALARELDEEMRFHRELLARDLERDGHAPHDAAVAARRQFGNDLGFRERTLDASTFPLLVDAWFDVRYAARTLRRSPGFAVIAIFAIGIAIGINSGFFTLIDTFAWRPMPVARPDRLVKLSLRYARGNSILLSHPDLQTIARNSRSLEDVFATGRCSLVAFRTLTAAATASAGSCVSGNYFAALGGEASRGRTLVPADDREGAPPVIVISDALWTSGFARTPDIIGRDVVLNGTHATVVGVIRREFIGVIPVVPEFWMSISTATQIDAAPGRLADPLNRWLDVRARLRQGVTREAAEAELSGLVVDPTAPAATRPNVNVVTGMILKPNNSMLVLNWQNTLVLMPALTVVALVLVIACANLANLMLSRGLARQREIAVRLAIGASRGRIVRQLLAESLLISLCGAAVGLLLSRWAVTIIARAYFANMPSSFGTVALNLDPSWRVVAYTIGLAVASVLIFGLTPALQVTPKSLNSSLKRDDVVGATRIRRSSLRDVLVAAQVAASMVLLVASGTLIANLRGLESSPTGLETTHVAVASLGLSAEGRVSTRLDSVRRSFASRVGSTDGVSLTARALRQPYEAWFPWLLVSAGGARAEYRRVQYNVVTPTYFDVVQQRIVSGRAFTPNDSATAADVAIVTAAAARTFWPRAAAVGQTLRVAAARDEPDHLYRIVGVAADAHSGMLLDPDDDGYVYLSASAADFSTHEMPLLVRSDLAEPELARAIIAVGRQADPNEPVRVDPVQAARDLMLVPIQYASWITSGVGGFGLALALIGLYGIVSFAVAQRQRDIAIHMALGATPTDVLRLVLTHEMRLVAAGLAVGLVLSIGEARLIAALIAALTSLGMAEIMGIAGLLLGVAFLASLVPGLSALRIAPMFVLRQD
jgi:macrolide transport system ATP-binding/permease protein